MVAVQQDGEALNIVRTKWLWRKDGSMEVTVKRKCSILCYASQELKNDRDVVIAAVKHDGYALQYVSNEMKNDKDVVMIAVEQDGGALQYASFRLKNKRDVVMTVVEQDVGLYSMQAII